MKKFFLFLGMLAAFKCTIAKSDPIHLVSKEAGIDITTTKVTHLQGPILEPTKIVFDTEMAATIAVPGPRVIIINSPGGRVDLGQDMIDVMELERKTGVKEICVVEQLAASMAFNFLSHCDVRLATADSQLLFHAVAMGGLGDLRLTDKNLNEIAKQLAASNEPYKEFNRKVLGMTREEYEHYEDEQKFWSAAMLYFRHYLHGIATVTGDIYQNNELSGPSM